MATTETSAHVTSATPSATQLLARDVYDKVRNLVPGYSKLLALVSVGNVKMGELTKQKGLIGKRSASNVRVECFTNTPLPQTLTVASVSSLTLTLDSATGLCLKQLWKNTSNDTVGRVDAISTLDITFVTVGSVTFSAAAGDTIQLLGNAYPENSSDPAILGKTDDNHYNLLQIFRFPVAISASAKAAKQLAGGDYFARMKKQNYIYAIRNIENALIWSDRAATNNTTTGTQVSDTFRSTRGLWKFAAKTFNSGGSFTPAKWRLEVPAAMSSTVNDEDTVVMLTSKEVLGRMNEWAQDKLIIQKTGMLDKFGVKSTRFIMNGPDVEVIPHNSFNAVGNQNKALIFTPDNLEYRFLNGRDLAPKSDIQDPSTDGFEDELMGEIGLLPLDGGESICKLTNLF